MRSQQHTTPWSAKLIGGTACQQRAVRASLAENTSTSNMPVQDSAPHPMLTSCICYMKVPKREQHAAALFAFQRTATELLWFHHVLWWWCAHTISESPAAGFSHMLGCMHAAKCVLTARLSGACAARSASGTIDGLCTGCTLPAKPTTITQHAALLGLRPVGGSHPPSSISASQCTCRATRCSSSTVQA